MTLRYCARCITCKYITEFEKYYANLVKFLATKITGDAVQRWCRQCHWEL